MTRCRQTLVLASIALAVGCDYSVWLTDGLDGGIDAEIPDAPIGRDAQRDAPDAPELDAGPPDAPEIDAGPPRACETAPSMLGMVTASGPLEEPTFATSGRGSSLRYAVLVPPAASATTTEESSLIVADREGAVLFTRPLRIEDATMAPVSSGTVHALLHGGSAEGFVVLGPTAIWILDEDGLGDPIALATAPSPAFQRTAGWVDEDRFAFVTEDLQIAVLDRLARTVSPTVISAAGASVVHIEVGGVTTSGASGIVVYDPDLSGTETLRTTWTDGGPIDARLVAAATYAGRRTWFVRDNNEFRTAIATYHVIDPDRPTGVEIAPSALLSPITATLEGSVVALRGSAVTHWLYSLASDTFIQLDDRSGVVLVEPEDEERIAVLTLRSDPGPLHLALECGVR